MSALSGTGSSERTSIVSTGSAAQVGPAGQDQQVAAVAVGRQQVGVEPDDAQRALARRSRRAQLTRSNSARMSWNAV